MISYLRVHWKNIPNNLLLLKRKFASRRQSLADIVFRFWGMFISVLKFKETPMKDVQINVIQHKKLYVGAIWNVLQNSNFTLNFLHLEVHLFLCLLWNFGQKNWGVFEILNFQKKEFSKFFGIPSTSNSNGIISGKFYYGNYVFDNKTWSAFDSVWHISTQVCVQTKGFWEKI